MIRHVVLWSLKEEADGRNRRENAELMREKLLSLKGKVPGLLDLKVHLNENPDDRNPAEVLLESVHPSWEALQAYQNHPLHREVGAFVSSVRQERLCTDFSMFWSSSEKDITKSLGDQVYNLRASALVIHDGHLLVMHDVAMGLWILPGGRISLGETAAEALEREMREETGGPTHVGAPALIVENFFSWKGNLIHEHCWFLRTRLAPHHPLLPVRSGLLPSPEPGLDLYWKPLASLGELGLLPAFLADEIPHVDLAGNATRHLVHRALK